MPNPRLFLALLVLIDVLAPRTAATSQPVVLTIMGKVAESTPFDQKALLDFGARSGVQIRFAQSLQTVTERIALFLSLLNKHSPEPDLIDMDVIWPATLGRYLVDLRPYFKDELKNFSPELLRNFTVDGRLVALPTFVDAGVLYYRADLLAKYGFRAPPATWRELEQMAVIIQSGERRSGKVDFWGYVWQGGAYESLTCNALEWQSSSGGGAILAPDKTVLVQSPQFLTAVKRAVSWIGRISPPGQTALGEDDGVNFWRAGRAAFMRGWTGQYAGLLRIDKAIHSRTLVAELPGGKGGRHGALGGSGMGVSLYSTNREQAIEALRVASSEATQRERAALGGFIPSRIALLNRPDVMANTPLSGHIGFQVVDNVVARPSLQAGPSYSQVSHAYYTNIHAILARKIAPEAGLAQLEAELTKIMSISSKNR